MCAIMCGLDGRFKVNAKIFVVLSVHRCINYWEYNACGQKETCVHRCKDVSLYATFVRKLITFDTFDSLQISKMWKKVV